MFFRENQPDDYRYFICGGRTLAAVKGYEHVLDAVVARATYFAKKYNINVLGALSGIFGNQVGSAHFLGRPAPKGWIRDDFHRAVMPDVSIQYGRKIYEEMIFLRWPSFDDYVAERQVDPRPIKEGGFIFRGIQFTKTPDGQVLLRCLHAVNQSHIPPESSEISLDDIRKRWPSLNLSNTDFTPHQLLSYPFAAKPEEQQLWEKYNQEHLAAIDKSEWFADADFPPITKLTWSDRLADKLIRWGVISYNKS